MLLILQNEIKIKAIVLWSECLLMARMSKTFIRKERPLAGYCSLQSICILAETLHVRKGKWRSVVYYRGCKAIQSANHVTNHTSVMCIIVISNVSETGKEIPVSLTEFQSDTTVGYHSASTH